MNDLNFFESLVEKKKDKGLNKGQIVALVVSLIFVALAIFLLLRQFKIKKMDEYVSKLQETAEDPTTIEKIDEILRKEEEKNAYGEAVNKIRDLDQTIISKDRIDGDLFEKLTISMPDTLFLSSIQLSETGYTLTGVSENRWDIAEFHENLENTDGILKVFTPNISYSDGFFDFSIRVGFEEILPELPEEDIEEDKIDEVDSPEEESLEDTSSEQNDEDIIDEEDVNSEVELQEP